MSKRKILQRGKKRKKTPLRNGNSIGHGTQGTSSKKPMKSFASNVIREGKAPRDRKKRIAIKANARNESKSITAAQKQKTKAQKPISNKSSIKPPQKKPSKFKRTVSAVKKTVSNAMRKGMQMMKKMARPVPKNTKTRVIKKSSPKR